MTGMAKHWSLVNSSGCPTARSGHCVTVAKDEMYMFGGCGHPGKTTHSERHTEDSEVLPICLGDLHVFNVARQRWREVAFPTAKTRPAQRTCAAICASDEEDRLFLSGGAGDDPYDLRGDLLQYDVREQTWSVLYDGAGAEVGPGPESCPFRRIGHTMVHHSAGNRLVLFGGSTGLEYFDDAHAFDLATGSWTLLATVGDRPSPRYKHQAFVDGDFMYVIGGGSYEPEGPDLDVYRLALVAGGAKALRWERLTPTGSPPRCRAAHGLAWDRVGRAAYVWGGFTSGMELDSTFCALRLPPTPPPAAATPPPVVVVAAAVDKPAVAAAATAAAAAAEDSSTAVASVAVGIPPAATEAPAGAASPPSPPPPPPAPPAPPAALVIDEHRELGRSTEAVARSSNSSRVAHGRNRRTLSADAAGVLAAAAARENKPSGSASGAIGEDRRRRAAASGTELAEQQQWQENPQHEQPQQPQPQPQQQQQQQPSPPLSSETADSRSSPGGADGRDRWRRRGQRLWRQGSGTERGGDNEGRTRRPRGSRRRSWGQGWASGRLQGLWGGGGSGGGGGSTNDTGARARGTNQASPPVPSLAAPLPPPPPPVAAGMAPVLPGTVPPPVRIAAATADAAVVAGEELSWVSLPSGQGGSAACGAARGVLPPSSPAGRSFHCAFFHDGACYVTGGSDGARKFGDMWRFPVRESPAPLTTLAARAFVSKGRNTATTTAAAMKESGGSEGVSGSHTELLKSLPQELRECLCNLNMQAEVVL